MARTYSSPPPCTACRKTCLLCSRPWTATLLTVTTGCSLGIGRSRLLFRTYFKGLPWIAGLILGLKPKWLRHLNSCKVLEQDVGLITTQEDWLAGTQETAGQWVHL